MPPKPVEYQTRPAQPKPTPAVAVNPPANNFEALKRIVQRIKVEHPDKAASYKYWASNANLHTIIDAAPKTVEELSRIRLNNDWQIREYMLAAEEIVALFSPQSQSSSPQVISTKPSKGLSLFSRLAGK